MAELAVNRFFIYQRGMRLAARQNSRYNPLSMDTSNTFISNKDKERPTLLILCLLFSILLHLLFSYLLYEKLSTGKMTTKQQEPTIVRLVEKPASFEKQEYELDQRPVQPSAEPPTKSSRLAEQNQRVDKEMAPKGDDVRDQTAKPAVITPEPPRTAKPAAESKQQKAAQPQKQRKEKEFPTKDSGRLPEHLEKQEPSEPPTLDQLTSLAPNTLSRISRAEHARRERAKQRDDIETGDTVWLNLERGLLISFFRRFRNQIEGVWNYPREAVMNEIQGTLLLKITVATDGELLDVDLLRSSGHEILDYEAIQAIYRAAPFGPLGKHYPHPDLKIIAHFRYQLSGKYIYGK